MARKTSAQVSVEDMDFSGERCTDHIASVQFLCKTCNGELVCNRCVTSTHRKHEFMELRDFANSQKASVNNVVFKAEEHLRKSEDVIKVLSEKLVLNDTVSEDLTKEIEKRGEALKSHIDDIVQSGRKKIERYRNKNAKILKKMSDEQTKRNQKLSKMCKECQTLLDSNIYKDTREAVDICYSLEEKMLKDVVGDTTVKNLTFSIPDQSTENDIKVLEELFGKLRIDKTKVSSVKLTLKSSFENEGAIFRICPVFDGEAAWLSGDSATLKLVTQNGEILETFDLDSVAYDMCNLTTSNGSSLLLVACDDNTIQSIATGIDTFSTVMINTRSKKPQSISLTGDGEIVVVSPYQTRLMRFGTDGKEIQTPRIHKVDEFELTKPQTVRVNKYSGQVAILNNEPNCLYVFDENFSPKFSYKGHMNEGEECGEYQTFDPQDLSFDQEQNIIVADIGNDSVYLLDNEGHFLQTLISGNGTPLAVEMHHDSLSELLWVGYESGNIEIYDYNYS